MCALESHKWLLPFTCREPADLSARCQHSFSDRHDGGSTLFPFVLKAKTARALLDQNNRKVVPEYPHHELTIACPKNSIYPRRTRDEEDRKLRDQKRSGRPADGPLALDAHGRASTQHFMRHHTQPDARALHHSVGRSPSDAEGGSGLQPLARLTSRVSNLR